jgi:hypothetical protein
VSSQGVVQTGIVNNDRDPGRQKRVHADSNYFLTGINVEPSD